MRVLHVIPAVAPRYGGPSAAVLAMTRALSEAGVATLIATTDADGAGRLPVELGRVQDYAGVPAIFFRRQWSEAFKFSRPLARWLDGHAGDFDAVHIHAVFSHACVAAARACRAQHVPYVVRPLGSLDKWSLSQKPLRKRVFLALGAGRALRQAAAIHYTSVEEQHEVQSSLGLARGVVVPLGADAAVAGTSDAAQQFRARHQLLQDSPYVLALSRLHPVKRLELLLDAFLEVTSVDHLNHWRLVIAGSGEPEYEAALRDRVHARGGDERVVFAGWLGSQEKDGAMRGASLFALTSQHENFGVAAAEALVYGIPVLVSTQVNLAEEVRAAGAGWITTLDLPSVTRTLADALEGDAERRRRGAAARALALERYTWRSAAQRLVRVYESIATE